MKWYIKLQRKDLNLAWKADWVVLLWVRPHVCVSVCESQRVSLCVWERMCLCVWVCKKESLCVCERACVCEIERVCLCVCVCVRERVPMCVWIMDKHPPNLSTDPETLYDSESSRSCLIAFWIPLLSAVQSTMLLPSQRWASGWLSIRFTYSSFPEDGWAQQSPSSWHGLPHLVGELSCEEQRSEDPSSHLSLPAVMVMALGSSSQAVPPGGLPASEKLQCCKGIICFVIHMS